MIQKDFLLRMIAELGQALREAVELYREGRTDRSRDSVDDTFTAYFDMAAEAARRMPQEALAQELADCAEAAREKYRLLADLLLLDGDLLHAAGETEEAAMAWRQALFILTWMQGNIETVFSFARQGRIQELAERLASIGGEGDLGSADDMAS